MPVIDYICTFCEHVDSTFLPISMVGSEHPEAERSKCSGCGSVSERNYSGAAPSTGFLVPPVVHYNRKTGEYSIPGHRDDPVDRGYVAVEIRDMHQYNKLCKSVNSTEQEKAQFLQQREREFFDARMKEQREDRKRQVTKAVDQGGYWREWTDENGYVRKEWCPVTQRAHALLAASMKYADSSVAKRRQRVSSNGANFHSRMLEHRESERSVVDGAGKKAVFFFGKK